MKVSTNSWLYRQADRFNWEVSNSLCVYFWQVVWAVVFWWVILPVIAVAVAVFMLAAFPLLPGQFVQFILDWTPGDTKLTSYLWTLGIGYATLIVGFAIGFAYMYWKNFIRKEKAKSPDNLVIAYLKAKKRKICPLIEFTNEE